MRKTAEVWYALLSENDYILNHRQIAERKDQREIIMMHLFWILTER